MDSTLVLLAILAVASLSFFFCFKTSSEKEKLEESDEPDKPDEPWAPTPLKTIRMREKREEGKKLPSLTSNDKTPSAFMNFALRCFQTVAKSTNLVLSPLSLGASLSLVVEASTGETRRQITTLLGSGANAEDISSFYSNLIESLTKTSRLIVRVTTAIFVNKDIQISPEYVEHVRKSYAAVTTNLDFSDGKNSAKTVNEYIEIATEKMVRSSISENEFKPDSGAIMINALYFEADWGTPFRHEITEAGVFFGLEGDRQESFMSDTRLVRCAIFDEVKILQLTYKDTSFSLLLLMPCDDFVEWRASLTAGYIEAALDNLPSKKKNADVLIPKFSIETNTSWTEALQHMGVKGCFDRQSADLSGLAPATPMFIEKIIQSSTFIVDEEGTRAATVTMGFCVAMCPPVDMEFSEPFLYCLLKERDVLFIGQFV